MRGLTIRQPWAWAITHGGKRVENRSQPKAYRGPLAIHAGLQVDDWALTQQGPALDAIRAWRAEHPGEQLQMPAGAIVAVARLVDCHEDDDCHRPWGEPLIHHLVLADVTPLAEPVPYKGALGLWKVEPKLAVQLAHGLPVR